jgi:hypothetical protein
LLWALFDFGGVCATVGLGSYRPVCLAVMSVGKSVTASPVMSVFYVAAKRSGAVRAAASTTSLRATVLALRAHQL